MSLSAPRASATRGLNRRDVLGTAAVLVLAVVDLKTAIAEKPGLTVLARSGDPDNLYIAHPAAAADLIFLRELGLDLVVPDSDPEEYWDTFRSSRFLAR